MTSPRSLVVVGGGLAAATAVETLRSEGYDGALSVVCAEPHLPYERPPLSKGYLLGDDRLEVVFPHDRQWYDDHDVELLLGHPADRLDPAARTVEVAGRTLRYDGLLVATGAAPRHLDAADRSGAPVAYLRTIEDSNRLRETFRPGSHVVLLGGGWIGLEVAAAARRAGSEVTVLEALELPLVRVLGPEVAQVFADLHREHGVRLLTGAQVTDVVHADRDGTAVVHLADGSTVAGDLLVVGIGAVPQTALAADAGLDVDDGVLTDAVLRTSAPGVLAAGDVARARHPRLGRHLRVEHWDTAIGQGSAAARNLLGAGEEYARLPYFFTDQYDLGMEYVGAVGPDGYDEVVLRGDVAGRVFTAFWASGGRVVAGMHVNDWDAIEAVRRIVDNGVPVDRLRDEATPLDALTA